MTHEVPKIGTDGLPLPVMPPERDPRLTIRVIRVMFYMPGFTALLLLKTGEPIGPKAMTASCPRKLSAHQQLCEAPLCRTP